MSSCALFAQEDISSDSDSLEYNAFKEHVPYWRLEKNWKFTPFDAFAIIPTFGIDHEVKMNKSTSFKFGAAFIPSFFQFATGSQDDRFDWMNGYRLRFESRFWGFKNEKLYISTELSCRHLVIGDRTAFGMEGDGNGNFAYFVNKDMVYHRFSTHLNLKVGWQFIMGKNLVLDLYTGLSLRRNNVLSGTDGVDGGVPQAWWNIMEWELRNGHKFGYATPIVNFRLGWNIPAKAAL